MNTETNATNADLSPTTALVRSYEKLMELQKVLDQMNPSSTTASTAEIEISSVITTPFTTVPLDDEPSLLESRAGTPAKAAHHSSSVVIKALMSLMELHTPLTPHFRHSSFSSLLSSFTPLTPCTHPLCSPLQERAPLVPLVLIPLLRQISSIIGSQGWCPWEDRDGWGARGYGVQCLWRV